MPGNFFIDLVDSGKIRSASELRSLYRHFVKRYHPDARLAHSPASEPDKAIDFDELKREYRDAAIRLERAAASENREGPFVYDPAAFIGELRDLVARGFPVSAKAVRKNKGYARSIDYVSKCLDALYKGAYGFAELDDQVKFLYARIPRVYWYVLQALWSCFDCASGYAHGATIAVRHLGCISHLLQGMGFGSLDAFLGDLIETAREIKRRR